MAKAKIIDSHSLECLIRNLHNEIEQADSQVIAYGDEIKQEEDHRQNDEIIVRLRNSRNDWLLRREVLHQCLCKIQGHTKEIEI